MTGGTMLRKIVMMTTRRWLRILPKTHVYLKQDIPHVGRKGEIVAMDPKAARNYFVPFKLAYYVPTMNGTPILPDGWKVKKIQTVKMPAIYPADPTISETDLLNATLTKERHVDVNTIVEKLESAEGPLVFERPLIETGKVEIYGSVSNVDICQEIQNTYKIPIKPNQIFMRQGRSLDSNIRIKSIGDYSFMVKLIKDQKVISVEMDLVVKGLFNGNGN